MGFDPTRRHRRVPVDYVFLAAGLLVAGALVVWALIG
jgi:hypothetical protein